MSKPVSILLCGLDAFLLGTRQLVLEQAGFHVQPVTQFFEIERIPERQCIDVLILCYSLSQEEIGPALVLVRERWPDVRAIVLSGSRSDCAYDAQCEVLNAQTGQQALIAAVRKMVP